MADQADFNKPDTTSAYDNQVFETLRASIKSSLALTPGARSNPGTGALRRSAPAAGEMLLEASDNDAGSAWSTFFDSRTKVKASGDTMSGALTVNAPVNTRIEVQNNADSNRGGYLSDTGSAFRIASNSAARPVEIAPNGTTAATFAVGGNVGIGEAADANSFKLMVANASSSGIRAGSVSIGSSGAEYPVVGFNVRFTATSDAYQYHVADKAAYIKFAGDAFEFSTAATGSAGAAMSPTQIANLSDGLFRLFGATPLIRHQLSGSTVNEISFGTSTGRGSIDIKTLDTAGANARSHLQVNSSFVRVAHGASGTGPGGFATYTDSYARTGVDFGTSIHSVFVQSGEIIPDTDNAMTCGASGKRFSAFWGVNGVIQTSDLNDKTDITPIDPDLATQLVLGLNSILYRWIVGGTRTELVEDGFYEVEVEVEEPYTEQIEEPLFADVLVEDVEDRIEVVDGRAVCKKIPRTRTESRPMGEWLDMFDEDGAPVMRQTGFTTRVVGRGENKREVKEPVFEQVKHFVPQTKTITVERKRRVKKKQSIPRRKAVTVEVPGQRMHAGYGAQDIKALLDSLGIDCGLWVRDESGKQHLRPDQLIPFLSAALAAAIKRIDALEQKLSI